MIKTKKKVVYKGIIFCSTLGRSNGSVDVTESKWCMEETMKKQTRK